MSHAAKLEAEKPLSTDARCLDQLARIRQSAEFDATDRQHRFLQYVFEETLSGRGDRIKAYTVEAAIARVAAADAQLR